MKKKLPPPEHYNICKKCNKIYTSYIGSLAHAHGGCETARDAREIYDFDK